MNRTSTIRFGTLALALVALGVPACKDEPPPPPPTLAPTATALAAAPAPAAMGAQTLSVDKASSKVDFVMDAPQEKIHGRVAGATVGDLHVDPSDLTKTTGLFTVDLSGIELFQSKADKDGKFAEETKSDAQNKHARTWLEISDDAPEAARAANGKVQFSIKSVAVAGEKDLSKLSGSTRNVHLTATGDFLLHGHKAEKTAELDVTFGVDGAKVTSVAIKSTKPFPVNLAEHDVKPRDAFGKFALKTLDALAPKVAKDAEVSVDLTAKP